MKIQAVSTATLLLVPGYASKCIYKDENRNHLYSSHIGFHFQLMNFSYVFVFTFFHLRLSPYHITAHSSWASCKAPEV